MVPLPDAARYERVPLRIVYENVEGRDAKPLWTGPVRSRVKFPRRVPTNIIPLAVPERMKPVVCTRAVSVVWPSGVSLPLVPNWYVLPMSVMSGFVTK
jgi:hypothetical protein